MIEALEGRQLLSTIQWINEGAPGSDTDNFSATYGTDADTARVLVRRALAAWESAITDFNYANLGTPGNALAANTYTVTISAAQLGVPGATGVFQIDDQGKPYTSEIELDDDGAGRGWFFDPTPGDNSEFTDLTNMFQASFVGQGVAADDLDFYRTVLNQVGHAMGFAAADGLAINQFLTPEGTDQVSGDPNDALLRYTPLFGPATVTLTTADGLSIYEGPADPAFPNANIYPNDLMNAFRPPGSPPTVRQLISDFDVDILRSAYGYTAQTRPSLIETFLIVYNDATGEVVVNANVPPTGAPEITIRTASQFGPLLIFVHSTVAEFDPSLVSSIRVEGSASEDRLRLELFTLPLPPGGITYNGNAGTDQLLLVGDLAVIDETYRATGPGSGVITLDGSTIRFADLDPDFAELQPVDDAIVAENLTFVSPSVPARIDVLSDLPTVQLPRMRIVSADNPSAFEQIRFFRKSSVSVNGTAAEDEINVRFPSAAFGLENLTLDGAGGDDQLNLQVTAVGIGYSLQGGTGDDRVTVLASALVAGSTYFADGGNGFDELIVDAEGEPVTVTEGRIQIGGRPPLAHAGFESITINNAAVGRPTALNNTRFEAIEGLLAVDVVVARFTDPAEVPASNYLATIDWADGTTTAGIIERDASVPSVYYVRGTHRYRQEGLKQVQTLIRRVASTTTTFVGGVPVTFEVPARPAFGASSVVDVTDAPVVTLAVPIFGVEGVPLTDVTIGTFTTIDNPTMINEFFTPLISWGDGTFSIGFLMQDGNATIGQIFHVRGSHTYADQGDYTITFRLGSSTNGGSVAIASTSARIADARIRLNATPSPLAATAGTPTGERLLGFFNSTDLNSSAAEYSAQIAWGDGTSSPARVVASGGDFNVLGSHTFRTPGIYPGTLTVRSTGGAETSAPFEAVVGGLGVSFPTLNAVQEVPFVNQPLATIDGDDGPPVVGANYLATIDYGDGTQLTPGFFQAGTNTLLGSHTYRESGVYTVSINVGTADIPTLASFVRTITVADVPIAVTGALDPASDSGISSADGVTNVNQPRFIGTSEPNSTVTLFATDGFGRAYPIGGTVADAAGNYSLVSGLALPDGHYSVNARAVDRNGVTTASTGFAPLLIDTVGPRVSGLTFIWPSVRITATLRDERSGLAQATLRDNRNFAVSKRQQRPGAVLLTTLNVSPAGSPTDPQTVTGVVNNGRSLRGGSFTITIGGSGQGITDVAGNALDGEFYGFFPSGNGVRGGDFAAIVDSIHRNIRAPRPTQGFGTPNTPAGEPGVRTTIGRPTPRPAAINSAIRRKRVAVAVDAPATARRDLTRPAASGRRSPAKA